MLQGFISLFSTPARAYAFILGVILFVVFIVIWRIKVCVARYSDSVAKEYAEKGKVGILKKMFLKKDVATKQTESKKGKLIINGYEVELPEDDLEAVKSVVDQKAMRLAAEAEQRKLAEKKKEYQLADKKKELQKAAEAKKKEREEKQKAKEKEKAAKEEEERKKEEEEKSYAAEEELEGLRNEGRRVMDEMAARIAEYEAKYQSYDQLEEILSYKDDIKDVNMAVNEASDLDRLLGRQRELESAFDWHKGMDIDKNPVIATREVALNEEQIQKFLDNMLTELVPLVDRGWSDAQITRSLANKTDYQIPTHEIVPMLEATRSCLGVLDSKEVNAKVRYANASYDISSARDALLRGDTREAMRVMEDRMKLLERTADSLRGKEQEEMRQKAAELSRHLAVLSKVGSIRDSFRFINHSLDLDNSNLRSLSVLGYMNLRANDLYGAEKAFMSALENSQQNEFWSKLARDGMETVNKLKDEEKKSWAAMMEKEEEHAKESNENVQDMENSHIHTHQKAMYRLMIRVREQQHTR